MGIFRALYGSKHDNDLKELLPVLHKINAREVWAQKLPDERFPLETQRLKEEYLSHKDLDALLPEAFALVREAARRTLGERAYDVQMLGGIVLHQGRIMELKTGEGKTLSSTAPAYLNALSGKGGACSYGERLSCAAGNRVDGAGFHLPRSENGLCGEFPSS